MSQALRSSDKALLERCLAVTNDRVVTNTVRRLLRWMLARLLRAAVERLQSKPSRGQQLAACDPGRQCWRCSTRPTSMSAPGAAP